MTLEMKNDNLQLRTLKTYSCHPADDEGGLEMELRNSTLENFITYWLDNVKHLSVKEGTLNRLKGEAKALCGYNISSMKIRDIRLHHIQDYVNELTKSGYSYTTIAKQRLIVTAPLRYAFTANLIDRDYTVGVKMPKRESVVKQSKEVVALSESEQEALRAALHKDPRTSSYIIEFVLETGLRVGEAQALTWKCVDFRRKCITIRATALNSKQCIVKIQASPKTKSSERTIPLSKRAVEILDVMSKQKYNEFVFTDKGELINYGRISKHYKTVCERHGITYCGVHSLRHTFATNCYYKGCNIKILSKLLGHSSTTITYNTYINLYGDGLEEMRSVLD